MMVSYLAGLCELCGEADSLATPEECQRAGLDVEASVCVACLKRMNPAAVDTIRIGKAEAELPHDAVMSQGPLIPRKPRSN